MSKEVSVWINNEISQEEFRDLECLEHLMTEIRREFPKVMIWVFYVHILAEHRTPIDKSEKRDIKLAHVFHVTGLLCELGVLNLNFLQEPEKWSPESWFTFRNFVFFFLTKKVVGWSWAARTFAEYEYARWDPVMDSKLLYHHRRNSQKIYIPSNHIVLHTSEIRT